MTKEVQQGVPRWSLFRRLGAWVVAAGILVLLLRRVSGPAVMVHLAGPHPLLFAYIFAACVVILLADAWATRWTLIRCGVTRPLRELILLRGALNLAGLVHLAAVQAFFGVYLYRHAGRHAGGLRRTLAMLAVLVGSQVGSLLVVGCAGLGLPGALPEAARLGWGLGTAGFLVAVVLLPLAGPLVARLPGRLALLAEELRPGGALTPGIVLGATVARLPHVAALAGGLWGGLRLWGVEVPFFHGMVLMPWTILTAALPVTPGGIGTTQAALVWLFTPYAQGASRLDAEAAVLSFGLLWTVYGLLSLALIGVVCTALLPRDLRPTASASDAAGREEAP